MDEQKTLNEMNEELNKSIIEHINSAIESIKFGSNADSIIDLKIAKDLINIQSDRLKIALKSYEDLIEKISIIMD